MGPNILHSMTQYYLKLHLSTSTKASSGTQFLLEIVNGWNRLSWIVYVSFGTWNNNDVIFFFMREQFIPFLHFQRSMRFKIISLNGYDIKYEKVAKMIDQ
mmetsp:Transcript_52142/g.62751  ORF Transcript_52142/g.62751 Transcript_52142/m.62751 type:complete len:100 (-) Transcript_52142:42-341(-)